MWTRAEGGLEDQIKLDISKGISSLVCDPLIFNRRGRMVLAVKERQTTSLYRSKFRTTLQSRVIYMTEISADVRISAISFHYRSQVVQQTAHMLTASDHVLSQCYTMESIMCQELTQI